MKNSLLILAIFLPLLLPACKVAPKDPFIAAERAASDGGFLQSLIYLDQVPPSHPNYAEARAFALALERRMRTSQEMVLRGMTMRSEWRDEEAIQNFEHALQVWPKVHGAKGMILATRHRLLAMAQEKQEQDLPEVVTQAGPVTQPGAVTQVGAVPAKPDVEREPSKQPEPVVTTEPVQQSSAENPATDAEAAEPKSETAGDSPASKAEVANVQRQKQLIQVTRYLQRGEMEVAMDLLASMRSADPKDQAVADMLARVLHQRALLRYGQGFLEGAIEDWQWVGQLQSQNDQAQAFLRAARTELALRQKR